MWATLVTGETFHEVLVKLSSDLPVKSKPSRFVNSRYVLVWLAGIGKYKKNLPIVSCKDASVLSSQKLPTSKYLMQT